MGMVSMFGRRNKNKNPRTIAIVARPVAYPYYPYNSYYRAQPPRPSLPCWFEPGPGPNVTACCIRRDGKKICAELRWG